LGDKDKARRAYQKALEVGAGQLSPKADLRIRTAVGRLSP
jgi:Flp pilus assembly protein TadD